jgi:hypothetical protein
LMLSARGNKDGTILSSESISCNKSLDFFN